MAASDQSFVHAEPRISELAFTRALIEGPKTFKGYAEIPVIWQLLTTHGVDPSYALGQFWQESLFGTAGWNIWSDPPIKAWGNILYVNSLLKDRPGVTSYAASNGYTYASYPDWATGVEDYCLLLAQYRDLSPDSRYGDTTRIFGATAKWMGKPSGSSEHENYLDVVLGRIARYDGRPEMETEMASRGTGLTFKSNQKYRTVKGEMWYVYPGSPTGYAFGSTADRYFHGQVIGTNWLKVRVITSRFRDDGKTEPVIAFMPNFTASRVRTG